MSDPKLPASETRAETCSQFEPLAVRIPEACRLTGISRSKLYELIADGQIEIAKIGSMTLVPMDSLRGLIRRTRKFAD
ncbi:excisionase family DNA binding protein [Novosphingobium sp. PhB165]|uniref:helix-turn-helix domain-containing protein n=1 Tax=Novosphingobium sp. PhB165 TaxID=2485105 RepID=UPI00104BBF44|nr:helix-turn-helix domain-containing protein [Novosphingobium sp. PhB165]TCM12024.1 excisionase family DNA binding protein [Novosphingobium sp. PhB165]